MLGAAKGRFTTNATTWFLSGPSERNTTDARRYNTTSEVTKVLKYLERDNRSLGTSNPSELVYNPR